MNQFQFTELCHAASHALGSAGSQESQDIQAIQVDGIDIVLAFNEEDDPDSIYCYIDLGEPKTDERLDVLQRLLQLNSQLDARPTRYALDAEGTRAMFYIHFANADLLDGEVLAKILRSYLDQTNAAREIVRDFRQVDKFFEQPTAFQYSFT